MKKITVAHSPDADDIFMYYAIKFGWVGLKDIYFENIEAIGQGALSDDEWKRILSGQAKENSDIVKKIEQRLKKLPEKTSLAILNLLESI